MFILHNNNQGDEFLGLSNLVYPTRKCTEKYAQ